MSTTTQPKVTYKWLGEHEWGLRSTEQLTIGETVTVSKRSRDCCRQVVGSLLSTVEGEYVYAIGEKE